MPDHDADFYEWANGQAALLRAGRLGETDIGHIAEEIESMGRSEKRVLFSRLEVLLVHLLKGLVQPDLRSTSRRLPIKDERNRLRFHLEDNPSLGPMLEAAYGQAYRRAVRSAQRETGLAASAFPAVNPWSAAEAMDEALYPA